MSLIHALVLGIVQGLTEFLPVSSSAHLVLVPALFHWPYQGLFFDIVLHFGTLVAIIVYFKNDIAELFRSFGRILKTRKIYDDPGKRLLVHLVLGTIPAVIIGGLFVKWFSAVESDLLWVGITLLVTSLLLVATLRVKNNNDDIEKLTPKKTLIIGLFQAFALLPGVSRSGSTIVAAVYQGQRKDAAAHFSFLLGGIGILAAVILSALDVVKEKPELDIAPLVVGFIASALASYFAIKYFIDFVKKHGLGGFAAYVFIVGIIVTVVSFVR